VPGSIGAGFYYNTCANLALDEGRLDDAVPLYAHSRSIAETTGDPGLAEVCATLLEHLQRVPPERCKL
jgi:hypothetical protein